MISLPIARREMLVLARSPAIYRSRLVVSILILLAGAAIIPFPGVLMMFRQTGAFLAIAGFFLMLFCLFAGAHATADAISQEKREGTLGLLYLTDMRTAQILAGKLIAHALTVVYGLITVFPLLSLMLLLGGVDGWGFLRLCAAALNTLFFSTAVGLFCSSLGVERRRTAGMATWIILGFWFLPDILGHALASSWIVPWWISSALTFLKPSAPFAFLGPGAPPGASFGVSLLVIHLLGWGFLAGAAYFLPRRWQDRASTKRLTFKDRWRQYCYGNSKARKKRRFKWLEKNPILWLSARHRLRPLGTGALLLVVFLVFAWIVRSSTGFPPFGILLLVVILGMVQKVMLCGAAVARLREEHEQGTLELLLSTPLKIRDIVRGNTQALLWQFRLPLLGIALVQVATFVWLVRSDAPGIPDDVIFALTLGVFFGLHYLDLWTITRVGPWAAVTARVPKQAAQTTAGLVIILPVLATVLLMLGGFLLNRYSGWDLDWLGNHLFNCYFALVFLNNIFWLTVFHRQFEVKLREFAAKRFSPEQNRGLIERLFSIFSRSKPKGEPPILRAGAA